MNAQEADHWWFVARRTIIDALIKRHVPLRGNARILEAGCGYGGNLPLLAGYAPTDALEYDSDARSYAQGRGIAHVEAGALPDQIGFGATQYDMIALLDVLEHIEQDQATLSSLSARLENEGKLLVTVPAMPWLWSHHDELHHHKRRYTKKQLRAVAEAAGLQVSSIGYFNSLLFPLAIVQRIAHKLLRSSAPLDARPSPAVNTLLKSIFSAERHLLDRMPFPVGLSLYAVMQKA